MRLRVPFSVYFLCVSRACGSSVSSLPHLQRHAFLTAALRPTTMAMDSSSATESPKLKAFFHKMPWSGCFVMANRRVTKVLPSPFPFMRMNLRNSWAQKNVRTCIVLAPSELTSTITVHFHKGLKERCFVRRQPLDPPGAVTQLVES